MSNKPIKSPEGNYKRIKVLKEGGFGKAYLCECLNDGQLCVVKEMKTQSMSAKEIKEARREAEILKVQQHPNIIRFRDVYLNEKKKLCIAMDFAEHGDLSGKIEKEIALGSEGFSEKQILDWFTQILLAIKHIHDRKIVHRDIKSQNIFVTKMNTIKLGDFGISKILTNTQDMMCSFVGTWYYLSPEIIRSKPYNFKTDVWSLGVQLYELCSLKLPFRGRDQFIIQKKIKDGSYEPLPVRFSKEMHDFVGTLLIKDATRRPNISQILNMEIIKNRIRHFLSENEYKNEFSHTVIHNFNPLTDPPPNFANLKFNANNVNLEKDAITKKHQAKDKKDHENYDKKQKERNIQNFEQKRERDNNLNVNKVQANNVQAFHIKPNMNVNSPQKFNFDNKNVNYNQNYYDNNRNPPVSEFVLDDLKNKNAHNMNANRMIYNNYQNYNIQKNPYDQQGRNLNIGLPIGVNPIPINQSPHNLPQPIQIPDYQQVYPNQIQYQNAAYNQYQNNNPMQKQISPNYQRDAQNFHNMNQQIHPDLQKKDPFDGFYEKYVKKKPDEEIQVRREKFFDKINYLQDKLREDNDKIDDLYLMYREMEKVSPADAGNNKPIQNNKGSRTNLQEPEKNPLNLKNNYENNELNIADLYNKNKNDLHNKNDLNLANNMVGKNKEDFQKGFEFKIDNKNPIVKRNNIGDKLADVVNKDLIPKKRSDNANFKSDIQAESSTSRLKLQKKVDKQPDQNNSATKLEPKPYASYGNQPSDRRNNMVKKKDSNDNNRKNNICNVKQTDSNEQIRKMNIKQYESHEQIRKKPTPKNDYRNPFGTDNEVDEKDHSDNEILVAEKKIRMLEDRLKTKDDKTQLIKNKRSKEPAQNNFFGNKNDQKNKEMQIQENNIEKNLDDTSTNSEEFSELLKHYKNALDDPFSGSDHKFLESGITNYDDTSDKIYNKISNLSKFDYSHLDERIEEAPTEEDINSRNTIESRKNEIDLQSIKEVKDQIIDANRSLKFNKNAQKNVKELNFNKKSARAIEKNMVQTEPDFISKLNKEIEQNKDDDDGIENCFLNSLNNYMPKTKRTSERSYLDDIDFSYKDKILYDSFEEKKTDNQQEVKIDINTPFVFDKKNDNFGKLEQPNQNTNVTSYTDIVKDQLDLNGKDIDYNSLDSLELRIFNKMCSCHVELLTNEPLPNGKSATPVLDDMFTTINDIFGKDTFCKKEDLVLYLSALSS